MHVRIKCGKKYIIFFSLGDYFCLRKFIIRFIHAERDGNRIIENGISLFKWNAQLEFTCEENVDGILFLICYLTHKLKVTIELM